MSDAKFFATNGFNGGLSSGIRGDNYSEFLANCQAAFGETTGSLFAESVLKKLLADANITSPEQNAVGVVTGTLGAQPVQQQPQFNQVPNQAPYNQPLQQAQPQQAAGVADPGPCAHGPRRFVAAGISAKGRPYPAFWGCTAAQGQQKCR